MSFEVRLLQLQSWSDEQEKAFTLHPKKEIELIIMSTPFLSSLRGRRNRERGRGAREARKNFVFVSRRARSKRE